MKYTKSDEKVFVVVFFTMLLIMILPVILNSCKGNRDEDYIRVVRQIRKEKPWKRYYDSVNELSKQPEK